ncbi:ATP-binding protein [Streptomyces sp. 3214.6]|uniref:ATP-binding protein n=1 Tax=Streptomyces sp. 3214.6 TaxID=1882757 RepID=UPI00090C6958|nr:ATP-binding protein [Streptomyces sp. 3214.6]SHH46356.1 Anti-sigma regulatory factor (Ser/Thr protein kinase) [Streptomyces sp. 3214.6]
MREEELASAGPATGPAAPVTTAASARAHARSVVAAGWDPSVRPAREADVIDLLLVVSELVANALRHGGGLAGFEMTPVDDGIRLAVHDHSEDLPAAACGADVAPAGHRTGGYGWPLVVRLARDVTIEKRSTGGKTITVFVPIRPTGPTG